MHWAYFIPIAFLCGSIPFGFLIGKINGVDIREHGSGNIGATNLGRVLGRRFFFGCFFLDMFKGLLPTAVAGHFMGTLGTLRVESTDAYWWLAVMVAAVLGHMFTPWLGFRGGKGVATMMGVSLGLAWPVGLAYAVTWLVMLAVTRISSLAGMTAAVAAPVAALAAGRGELAPVLVALALLVVWLHRANISRLRAGTEPKLGGSNPQ